MDDEQIDYFLDVLDGICAKFGTFDSGLPTHRPEGMQALRSAMRIFLATANASPAIVGTPSKEGAAQVEAVPIRKRLIDFAAGVRAGYVTDRNLLAQRIEAIARDCATPPASPSEGGGEQIAHIKQAIYTISGGDFDATDDEARRIAEAVLSIGEPAWVDLTDDDRERAMNSMPDMLEGFMKTWGWLHFAKAIEAICKEKNQGAKP